MEFLLFLSFAYPLTMKKEALRGYVAVHIARTIPLWPRRSLMPVLMKYKLPCI
jgi:hypothetical protein